MKIAVLFYGQPRFVKNESVISSHKLLEKAYDVDYFGHLWSSENSLSQHVSSWSNIKVNPFSKNDISFLKETYRFKNLVVEQPVDLTVCCMELIKKFQTKSEHAHNTRDISNIFSQLYSIEAAIDAFINSKGPVEYDYVVLSRTDNVILKFPNLNNIVTGNIYVSNHHPAFPDTTIIADPKSLASLRSYSMLKEIIDSDYRLTGTPENVKQITIKLTDNAPIVPLSRSVQLLIDNKGTYNNNSGLYSEIVRNN